jgi:prepilin-type N-terminal cleavage/methylation domain-containing protein
MKKKAFSLLEVLLTTIIILILASVSFPLLKKNIKTAEFKSYVNKTYLFLDYAKTQSIIKNVVLEVKADFQRNELVLTEREEYEQAPILSRIRISENIDIKLEPEKIIFYPDGSLEKFTMEFLDSHHSAVISSQGLDGKIVKELNR